MRLVLGIALILLFLWLLKAHRTSETMHVNACESASMSRAAASVLLSPLSLYSWTASTLLRALLSVPALLLGCLWTSLLLLLALPWSAAAVVCSLLSTCLHAALYLLHLAVGLVAILTFARHKMADGGATGDGAPSRWRRRATERQTKAKRVTFGRRVAQQG